MKRFIQLFLIVFIFCGCSPSWGQGITETFMPRQAQVKTMYLNKKTGQRRSTVTVTAERKMENQEIFYYITKEGQGDYDQYQDVTWVSKAKLKEEQGSLLVLESQTQIKDKQGEILISYKKVFDYDQQKIFWRSQDHRQNQVREEVFPIKGKTTDDISLVFFLKTSVAYHATPGYKYFYLLTNDPRLYKIKVVLSGSEQLELPIGKFEAVKVRLKPEVGIFDNLFAVFLPKTYFWYTKHFPYVWLQYEGLETTLKSNSVKAVLTEADEHLKSFLHTAR